MYSVKFNIVKSISFGAFGLFNADIKSSIILPLFSLLILFIVE